MRLLYIWLVVWVIVAFAFLGLFSNAYGDYYKTIGVYHKDNPSVCIMYPDEQEYSNIIMLQEQTLSAINEWEFRATNSTGGGNWNATITEHYWSEHGDKNTDDYPDCTIFINYVEGKEDGSLGRTSWDFSSSVRYYYWIEIDLYASERSLNITLGDDMKDAVITDEVEWKFIPANDVRNVVLHEYGHGLGIEHYYVTGDCREIECDYSPIMFGSIDVFEGTEKSITEKDIKMLIRIYGEDGYGFPQPKYIPRVCQEQCLDMDCGNSRMC